MFNAHLLHWMHHPLVSRMIKLKHLHFAWEHALSNAFSMQLQRACLARNASGGEFGSNFFTYCEDVRKDKVAA